jgi:hypothetical protein
MTTIERNKYSSIPCHYSLLSGGPLVLGKAGGGMLEPLLQVGVVSFVSPVITFQRSRELYIVLTVNGLGAEPV